MDWIGAYAGLTAAVHTDGVDEIIDASTTAMLMGGATEQAVPFFITAVQAARSDLTLRSAALALAFVAPPNHKDAVGALLSAYTRKAMDHFLAPALIEALGLLATRCSLARAELSSLLLRLDANGPRYLLIRGAQSIGRLDAMRNDPDLRAKLQEFGSSSDLGVQGEVRQQLALITLSDALLSDDRISFRENLTRARAEFRRAEQSAEQREDATTLIVLLDMLIAFLDIDRDRSGTVTRLHALVDQLRASLATIPTLGRGYRSTREARNVQRVLSIAEALDRAAEDVRSAEDWINLAEAVECLARLHADIRAESKSDVVGDRLPSALKPLADTIFAASLGPLLARVVQHRRLIRITDEYVEAHGEDEIARGLRALGEATAAVVTESTIPDHVLTQLTELAVRTGRPASELLAGTLQALSDRRIETWAVELGVASTALPIDIPDLYGNDPAIDEVVRPLLRKIASLLNDYPSDQWTNLTALLVSIVKFAHFVRDEMPPYSLCIEDGGLGQSASERDLQEDLFRWLRQDFGQKAVYELQRVGGGRPDTGVAFLEGRLPVEAKHEFSSISREHIRLSFVEQADAYAGGRVCFVMVLDLREGNANGHRERKKGRTLEPASLYSLRDSFWTEALAPDPDLPDATSNVLVIGLVPGNRPRPSSMAKYSRRPRRL